VLCSINGIEEENGCNPIHLTCLRPIGYGMPLGHVRAD